ncbi:MAG TPA: hypothetical protein VHO03_16865 [Ignavibacteriales bacterium]|nr:hypothetical protein [Ignavibacteriales bacterium]
MAGTYAERIAAALINCGFRFQKEYEFLKKRKYRFDFLILGFKGRDLLKEGIRIAVEYEGGIVEKGRHMRPKGYNSDCQKYNLAALNGYLMLRYTARTIGRNNGEYLVPAQIEQLIQQIDEKFKKEVHR